MKSHEMNELFSEFSTKINPKLVHIRKSHKNFKTQKTRFRHANDIIELLNELIEQVQQRETTLSEIEKTLVNKQWLCLCEKWELALKRLSLKIKLSVSIFTQKQINTLQKEGDAVDDEIEDDVETEDNLGAEDSIIIADMSIFDIKTATALVPTCDGAPDKVEQFIDAAKLMVTLTPDDQQGVLLSFVKTRLTGKARSVAHAETTLSALLQKLSTHCKPVQNSESLRAKLSATRQKMDTVTFTTQVCELAEKLEAQYIAEGITPEAATALTKGFAVEALQKGAKNPQTRLLMKAGNFTSVSEAVTKLLKEDTDAGEVAQILRLGHGNRGNGSRGGRGNYRGNYRGNNSRRGNSHRGGYRSNNYRGQDQRPNQQTRNVRQLESNPENQQGPHNCQRLGAQYQQ